MLLLVLLQAVVKAEIYRLGGHHQRRHYRFCCIFRYQQNRHSGYQCYGSSTRSGKRHSYNYDCFRSINRRSFFIRRNCLFNGIFLLKFTLYVFIIARFRASVLDVDLIRNRLCNIGKIRFPRNNA